MEVFFNSGGLTGREKEIVYELMQGYDNATITEKLCISSNTLKTHLRKIYRKCNVHKKSELLALVTTKSFAPDKT